MRCREICVLFSCAICYLSFFLEYIVWDSRFHVPSRSCANLAVNLGVLDFWRIKPVAPSNSCVPVPASHQFPGHPITVGSNIRVPLFSVYIPHFPIPVRFQINTGLKSVSLWGKRGRCRCSGTACKSRHISFFPFVCRSLRS